MPCQDHGFGNSNAGREKSVKSYSKAGHGDDPIWFVGVHVLQPMDYRAGQLLKSQIPTTPTFQVQRVSTNRSELHWVGYGAAALFLLAVGFWIGDFGGTPSLSAAFSRATLQDQIAELHDEIGTISSRLAIAERSSQIADSAAEQVRQQMIVQQDELRRLQSELDFYRGIVSERAGAAGIRLHAFDLQRAKQPGESSFELVLVRGRPDGKAVTGQVEIRQFPEDVDGSNPEALYERSEPVATVAFSFDFYQRLTGPFVVMERSGKVLVTLLQDGKDAKPVHFLRTWERADA